MIELYAILVKNGRRTISQVPAKLRDAVLAELAALGLDGDGNPVSE